MYKKKIQIKVWFFYMSFKHYILFNNKNKNNCWFICILALFFTSLNHRNQPYSHTLFIKLKPFQNHTKSSKFSCKHSRYVYYHIIQNFISICPSLIKNLMWNVWIKIYFCGLFKNFYFLFFTDFYLKHWWAISEENHLENSEFSRII